MLKAVALFLICTALPGSSGTVDAEKPTPEQIRQAKADFAAQKSRQRSNTRAQRKFIKAQRKAWKRSLKPNRRQARKTH